MALTLEEIQSKITEVKSKIPGIKTVSNNNKNI